jgi:hypothetical protein
MKSNSRMKNRGKKDETLDLKGKKRKVKTTQTK